MKVYKNPWYVLNKIILMTFWVKWEIYKAILIISGFSPDKAKETAEKIGIPSGRTDEVI